MDYDHGFQDIFTTASSADMTPSTSCQEHFAPQIPQQQQDWSYQGTPFFEANMNLQPPDYRQARSSSFDHQMFPAQPLGAMSTAQHQAFATQQNVQDYHLHSHQYVPHPTSTADFNTMAAHSPFASQQQLVGQQDHSPPPYPTPPGSDKSPHGQRNISHLMTTPTRTPVLDPAATFGSRAGTPRQNPNVPQGTRGTTSVGSNTVSSNNMAASHMATPNMTALHMAASQMTTPTSPAIDQRPGFLKHLQDRKAKGDVAAAQTLQYLSEAGSQTQFEARITEAYNNEVFARQRKVVRAMTPAAKQARIVELQRIQAKANAQQQKNAQAQAAQQQNEARARAFQQQQEARARAVQQQQEAQARAIQQQRAEQMLQARRQKEAEARRIKQQQDSARAAEAEAQRKKQAKIAEANRKHQAQEHQKRLDEEAEYLRIAQAQRLERERKLLRKEQLRKDPSALFRHYDEYLSYFPLESGQRRSQYHNNLLANRNMTAEANTDLDLAIQFAKDHWQWYLVFPKDADRATTWQKEKLAACEISQ